MQVQPLDAHQGRVSVRSPLTEKSAFMNELDMPGVPRLRPAHAPFVRRSERDSTKHMKRNRSRSTESPTKPTVRPLRLPAQSALRGSGRQGASNTCAKDTFMLQLATRPSSMGNDGPGEPSFVGFGEPSSIATSRFRPSFSSTRRRMARSTSSAASGSISPVCLERQLNTSSDEESVRARIGSRVMDLTERGMPDRPPTRLLAEYRRVFIR